MHEKVYKEQVKNYKTSSISTLTYSLFRVIENERKWKSSSEDDGIQWEHVQDLLIKS